ncbi:MAG: hypothetical protein ACW98F_14580 [Candidatus Hodarchaeales archaeon]|jgi:hypothetical protein
MIGIEITSKVSGIPLFTLEFRPDTLFNSEIRGGLITAIMQVMGETFGPQETKIVNYGHYNAILVEGKYVYGTLFTFQSGPNFELFIADLISDFEKKFHDNLESVNSGKTLIHLEHYDFAVECSQAYKSFSQIDVTNLSKLLDSIHSYGDKSFENVLIYTRPEMSQIYTHLIDERFNMYSDEVSKALKTVLDLSNRTSFPIDNFQIALSVDFHCLMFNVFPFSVIVFGAERDLELLHWRIQEIKTDFVED